jgi:hypothetical protein
VSLRTALLGSQRLMISCFLFRCANPLVKACYATLRWNNRRCSKKCLDYLITRLASLVVQVLNCNHVEDSNPARYLSFRFHSLFGSSSQNDHFRLSDCTSSLWLWILLSCVSRLHTNFRGLNCQKSNRVFTLGTH